MNGYQKFALSQTGISEENYTKFLAFQEAEVAKTTKDTEVKQNFGQATLEDGAAIYFPGDELSEGSIIYSDEGLETAVGAGEWTLENGDVITTGDDSAVTGIAVADAPEGDDEGGSDDEALAGNLEELLAVMGEFNDRLTVLEGSNESLSEENVKLKEDKEGLSDKLKTATGDIKKLSKVSTQTPNVAKADEKAPAFKTKHKLRGFTPINTKKQ